MSEAANAQAAAPASEADAGAGASPAGAPAAPAARLSAEERVAAALRVASGGDAAQVDGDGKEAPKSEQDDASAKAKPEGEQKSPPGREWKALRQRERAIAERERSLEATRSQLEGQVRDLGHKAAAVDKLSELAKSDPIGLLEHFGITIESLSSHYLDAQKPDALARREVQRALEAERKQREEAEAKAKADEEARQRQATEQQRVSAQRECLWLAGREPALQGYSPDQILAAAGRTAQEMLLERPQGFSVKDVIAEMVRRLSPAPSAPEAGDEPQSSNTPTGKGAPRAPQSGVRSISQAKAGESSGKARRLTLEERRAAAIKVAQGA